MRTSLDHRGRSQRTAGAVLAAIFAFVVIANLLWPGEPSANPSQVRMPPSVSPFPTFRIGPRLQVVPVGVDANASARLLLTSLQGIVNRQEVRLYLDTSGEIGNASSMLTFVANRYHLRYDVLTMDEVLAVYAPRAAGLVKGLVAYDPAKPESVNIGTMIAAQQDGLLVGPDLAPWMNRTFGLPVLFDYASSDWSSLDPIGASDRALRELYPASSSTLLAILPPDRWAIRDYLVATKTFVFYQTQGALASPFEAAATIRILEATPRGIPILGWFNSPTLTEENSFVQLASGEGKFVVGVQDLPNLSVLTALGRNETHRQVASLIGGTSRLENKTYIVLAVSDGDNLDFASGRMRDLWSESVRGTVPIAWSLSPLLVDLAPPLLDRYYDTATANDTFIAAPSGAGYLYPDYTEPGDLASFANFSRRYLVAADMNVVWLLNAFTASEISYTDASLSTYVDVVRPEGIVLDYDDQPRIRDAWMEAGAQAIAPVVRSTHFWTTADNVLGKLDAAMATWDGGPHFLWLTVYTYRFDLRDALSLVDALSARAGANVAVVSPSDFFGLLRQDFVRAAKTQLQTMGADVVASTLFGATLESIRARLRDADAYLAAGDVDRAAYAAYLALEDLRGVSFTEALLVSLLVILAAGVLAYVAHRSSRSGKPPSDPVRPGVLLVVTAAVALLGFALREALAQNFWTYPTIFIGIAVAGIHRPLRRLLDRAYPLRAPVAAALLDLVFVDLAIRTSAAFPLAMIGSLLTLETYLSRRSGGSSEVLAGLLFGTAVGLFGGFDLPTFSVLAVLLVIPTLGVRGPPIPERPSPVPRATVPGLILALPLSAIAVAFYYSIALRVEIQGDLLVTAAGALLVLAPTLAVLVRRTLPRASRSVSQAAALALAAAFCGMILLSHGTVLTILGLLGLFTALSFAALAALDEYAGRGGDSRWALATAVLFLPLLVLFFRMPPIVYSLTIVRLPEAVESALYTPTVMIAAAALAIAVLVGLRGRGRAGVGKDYPEEAHRPADGP